jgi:isopenicillin N synthase-like dioxygenase
MSSIPIIDLSGAANGAEAATACAQEIDAAARSIGFFAIRGHGVPRALIDMVFSNGQAFFSLPMEEKLKIVRPRPEQNRAYISFGSETLARLNGRETPPDFKEVFTMGPPDVPDEPYYTCEAAGPSFAPNLWPEHPASMKPALLNYWDEMQRLSRLLVRLFALGLNLPEDYFIARGDKDISMLRVLHYPPYIGPVEPGQLRAGEHTDLSMLTIVHSNNNEIGGLEVRTRDGQWMATPNDKDLFIVNIGDTMMRWTNDRWVSTPHRVVNPATPTDNAGSRLSTAFFFMPNYDTRLACLDSCAGEGAKYEPTTIGEYRTARFRKTANAS